MSTRILERLIFSSSKLSVGIENATLSRIPLRYYLVCYVTCSHGTDCHAESPAGGVQCFKVAKSAPVSPFYPTLWMKKATLQRENPQEVRKTSLSAVNIYFCAFRNWKCSHIYRRPTMKIPELRWCLITQISFNNPSQFPGMF